MQPQTVEQWNLRYLISEAIRSGAKIELDSNGEIVVNTPNSGHPLLVEQTTSRVATNGKRRGFNGKQPRITDGQSHPCTVTTADGRQYVFTKRTTKTEMIDRDVQNLIRNLPASNGGNPDA